jgi:tetratricopeptide (TPR) repeat protein
MQDETERGAEVDTAPRPRVLTLERGNTIGRYVVLDKLGAGGMGVVVAAYDPELDRKLAIKLLHPETSNDEVGRVRLLREAQALAKLSHPNVVAVHDVGTIADSIWIAMELVRGVTLREWMVERPRRWQEVLTVMVAAGRGLAAAHAAGLIHRDFKPSNVMIDGEGRVRVLDFGLARRTSDRDDPARQTASTPRVAALGKDATAAGKRPGTVAYMSNEQFEGGEVDPRTDQFSYCVALWEMLFGERPFVADSPIALARMVAKGRARAPKGARAVPSWLRRVLERGLSPVAKERWASMAELLAALERGQIRERWRKGAVIVLGVAGVVGIVAGVGTWSSRRHMTECGREGEEIAAVWNDESRARLTDGLMATGAPHAAQSAERIVAHIDREAAAWREIRTHACIATRIDHTWTEDALARTTWCLAGSRAQMAALLDLLGGDDPTAPTWGVSAALQSEWSKPCADADKLARQPMPPRDREAALADVQGTLLRAHVLQRAGRFDEGLVEAREAVARAHELQWAPTSAAAQQRLGEMLSESGHPDEAIEPLRTAYFEAMKVGVPLVAAHAATRLVFVLGQQLGRRDEGLQWADHADVALATLGEPEGVAAASAWIARAILLRPRDHAAAVALYERALAVQEAELGPSDYRVAVTLLNLANAHSLAGSFDEAKPTYARSLAIFADAVGEQHPTYAMAAINSAKVETELGNLDAAQAQLEHSLTILEAVVGSAHPSVSTAVEGIAEIHLRRKEYDKAAVMFERVLASQRASAGENHPDLVYTYRALAEIELARGRPAAAVPHARRVVELLERTGDTPDLLSPAKAMLQQAIAESPAQ